MEVTQFADPVKIGPGVWFTIHLKALHATTEELKRSFASNIDILCINFRCQECQTHFRKYLDSHPLSEYWNRRDSQGRDIGFFLWSWEFHNAVNSYLKKYQPTFEESYEYYRNNTVGVCTDCGHGSGVGVASPLPSTAGSGVGSGVTPHLSSSGIAPLLTGTVSSGVGVSGADAKVTLISSEAHIPPILEAYRAKKIAPQPFKRKK